MMIHRFLAPFQMGMRFFGERIGVLVNTILLGVVYFVGIGLTSLVARVAGKKMLDDGSEPKDTYWISVAEVDQNIARYRHQF